MNTNKRAVSVVQVMPTWAFVMAVACFSAMAVLMTYMGK